MATIGSFEKTGHDYSGQIVTLSVQAKGVRIAAEPERGNEAAPSHRVSVGNVESGAAQRVSCPKWSGSSLCLWSWTCASLVQRHCSQNHKGRSRMAHPKLMLAVVAMMSGSLAQAAPTCRTTDIEARFRTAIAPVVDRADVAGFSVAAGVADGYRWSHSWGMANLELDVPMTPASKVRIGSVSKLLTSAALVRLAAKGTIDLDAPIQNYVDNYPRNQGPPITARLLSGHLAGVRHYVANDLRAGAGSDWDGAYVRPFRSVDEAVELFKRDELLSSPGTRYHYSSFGWTLLSSVMEKAAGTPFLDILQREVITPLGLAETLPDKAYDIIQDRAAPYEVDASGVLRIAPPADRSYVWAGGGYLSTARDLVRFATAHRPGAVFGAPDLQLLFTAQQPAVGSASPHGVGWDVVFEPWTLVSEGQAAARAALVEQAHRLPRTVWHSGGAPGGASLLLYDPEARLAVAMVTNGSSAKAHDEVVLALVAMYGSLAEQTRRCATARPKAEQISTAVK